MTEEKISYAKTVYGQEKLMLLINAFKNLLKWENIVDYLNLKL